MMGCATKDTNSQVAGLKPKKTLTSSASYYLCCSNTVVAKQLKSDLLNPALAFSHANMIFHAREAGSGRSSFARARFV